MPPKVLLAAVARNIKELVKRKKNAERKDKLPQPQEMAMTPNKCHGLTSQKKGKGNENKGTSDNKGKGKGKGKGKSQKGKK